MQSIAVRSCAAVHATNVVVGELVTVVIGTLVVIGALVTVTTLFDAKVQTLSVLSKTVPLGQLNVNNVPEAHR